MTLPRQDYGRVMPPKHMDKKILSNQKCGFITLAKVGRVGEGA